VGTAANVTAGPAGEIGELGLSPADVSMWAADRGLDRSYDELRSVLQEQLNRAVENFHSIAAALRQTADTYEREDLGAAQNLKQTY
jgi:hypothetical protein